MKNRSQIIKETVSKILFEQEQIANYKDHPYAAAASMIHDAWLERNADWASDEQKKSFKELSPSEQKKDVDQVELINRLRKENKRKMGESHLDYEERLANIFGSHAHDTWRSGRAVIGQNSDGSPRFEPREKPDKITGQVIDIANTPFDQLSAGHKQENYLAGVAAAKATRPVTLGKIRPSTILRGLRR